MEPAESIERLGFRRWYERQLIEAHVWLVTCILCALAVVALIEGVSLWGAGWEPVLRLALAFAAGAIGWHAGARYAVLMSEAHRIANRSTCESCGTSGRFEIVGPPAKSMMVRCRRCGHQWKIA